MNGYLLDTCTIARWFSETSPDVDGRIRNLGQSLLYLSAITIGEFMCGHASTSNTNTDAQKRFREWLKATFGNLLVCVEEDVAYVYGPFRATLLEKHAPGGNWGKKKKRPERCEDINGDALGIDENDLWLVAQADTFNLTLVTMDKMTRLREVFGKTVPIIYWPEDPSQPAEYSDAAVNRHHPT